MDALIPPDHLKPEAARKSPESAIKCGELKNPGEGSQKIITPGNPFDKSGSEKKKEMIERLKAFLRSKSALYKFFIQRPKGENHGTVKRLNY